MGILICLLFLFVNLLTNYQYGYTWDLPHHFNAGLRHLGLAPLDPAFGTQPYGPIADTLPVAGWLLFYKNWHLLPPDEAYHLFLIVAGAIGVFIIYQTAKNLFGNTTALFSAIFLALYPRYIGHSHNNMKDGLSAVAIAFAVWMFIAWFKKISHKNNHNLTISQFNNKSFYLLLLASFSVAIAFNTKVNAMLLPIIIGLWLLISFRDQINLRIPNIIKSKIGNVYVTDLLIYCVTSVFFSLLLWSFAWPDPFFQLTELFRHFSSTLHGFNNLYFGNYYYVGINVPWHFALGYFLAVTPTLMIFFVLTGLLKLIYDTATLKNRYSALILAWFFVPVLKYINPNIGVFDDIRHFLEAVFPLCIMAGIGATIVLSVILKTGRTFFDGKNKKFISHVILNEVKDLSTHSASSVRARLRFSHSPSQTWHPPSLTWLRERFLSLLRRDRNDTNSRFSHQIINHNIIISLFYIILIIYLLFQIIPIHPYETSYFSEWTGGVKGAQGKFDIEFWGHSLKEGSLYLNKTAPKNSIVSVPMAQHLAREYLRPDITVIQYANEAASTNYIMFFNRQSFIDMYPENNILKWYLANKKPIFTIERQGAVLLWIYIRE